MYRVVSGSSSDREKYVIRIQEINKNFAWNEKSKYFVRVEEKKVLAYIEVVDTSWHFKYHPVSVAVLNISSLVNIYSPWSAGELKV